MTPSLTAKSNAADNTDVILWADPSTHRLLVNIVGGTGTSSVDTSTFTAGTTVGTPAMGEYTSGGAVIITGNVGILAMTAYRALQVAAFDSAGNDATDTTNHAIRVNIVAGAGSGGTALADEAAFTAGTTQGTPAMGVYQTSPSTISNGTAATISIDVNRNQKVVGTGTAGTAAGGVLTVQGVASMTPVQVSQATAASLNATVVGTGTFAVQAAATLNAETTKVIGVVRNSDGAGNLLTSNSTTPSAHFALDMNVTSILGTAPTTVGKLDVKGADGDVFVRQATGTNLHMVVDSGTITTVSTVTAVTTVSTVTAVTAITNALPAGTNLMGKVGIDQTTVGTTNGVSIAQIGATTVVNGGLAGSLSIGGTAATNGTITANPINTGAQAVTSENTAVTTAKQVQLVADVTGRLITFPYANKENLVSGIATATGTTDTALIAAQGAGLYVYITSLAVVNTGATSVLVTIETDTASAKTAIWYMTAPAGGGMTHTFTTPIRGSVTNKNVGFVAGGSTTTLYVSASGYAGT